MFGVQILQWVDFFLPSSPHSGTGQIKVLGKELRAVTKFPRK